MKKLCLLLLVLSFAINVRAQSADAAIDESPISIKTLSGVIKGTLSLPKGATGKIPVILIIAGQGQIDRDGNGPGLKTNAYKMLSVELAKKGFASVRYDKRMVGESGGVTKESNLRFEDYVDDALGFIQLLADDERFSKVIVLGHSEGSLVGMMASRDQPVKGFISVAGAGDSADKLLTEQMKSKPQYISDNFKVIIDSLARGKITEKVDPALYYLARPTIQNFLMSWCRYNPARIIKMLKMPVLILQGTTDLQVTVADAEKLKKGKADANLTLITGMNYVLKDAPADKEQNMATYTEPNLPLKPEFVAAVIKFIQKIN